MKRFIVLLACICMLFTGCNKSTDNDITEPITDEKSNNEVANNDEVDEGNTGDKADNNNDKEADDNTVATLLKLNEAWSLVKTVELDQPEFTLPAYSTEVKPYKIADDLSNVENIDRFEGFTKEQKKQLVENGFIVLPARYTKSYHVYDNNEYSGIPNFVTSDAVLHLYHQFYDKSLMFIETEYLYKDLDMMTKQMLDKSILLLQQLKDDELKALQKKNIAYFMVARMLFLQTKEVSVEVDVDIKELAVQEYELAQAAAGIQMSPLFGHDIDYSQFTVRGHYTRSEELSKFFGTMMWFSLVPLDFGDVNNNINYDNVLQALLISYTTIADSQGTCDAELWSDIYEPTSSYVGLSDDINVFTMNGLRSAVFGNNENPDIYNDEEYHDQLTQAVKALPQPRIQGELLFSSIPTALQFRFMGQRYILDSEILQKLMKPIVRPVPTALDVMGVLGSKTAEELLFNVYKPQDNWPDYTDEYNKLKSTVHGYDKNYWQTNLYSGWLWSLQSFVKEYTLNSGMPFFMTTQAWKYKSLNAALGSYTELKHDSVLYGKQAVAEMGGPLEAEVWHYVEPNIELFSKLKYLTEYTCSVLSEKEMLSSNLKRGTEEYIEFLQLLINCSIKELRNEPLTAEENRKLLWTGGTMESICLSFTESIYMDSLEERWDNATMANDPTDMLVTDIATIKDNDEALPLSLGTGYFDDIFVVTPHEDKLYLTRGCVYSFYEFLSSKRLTDEEWWKLQGIAVDRTEFGDFIEMGEPSKELPKQPDWISNFKSDSNEVNLKPLEVDWDNLVE